MLNSIRVIIPILFILAMFLPKDGLAQNVSELLKKELPLVEFIPKEEFDAQTYLYEDVPLYDDTLAYSLRIPNSWEQKGAANANTFSIRSNLLGDIVTFQSGTRIDAARSLLKIQAVQMTAELSADQWFLEHILKSGYTIEGIKIYNERKVEALYVYINQGNTFVVRTMAQISGNKMLLAQYTVPAEYWMQEKVTSAQVINSFELRNPVRTTIETFKEYKFLDLANILYPETWKIKTQPITNLDRIGIKLENIRKNTSILDGQIYFDLVSADIFESLEQELNLLRRKLTKQGLLMGALIETIESVKFHKNVTFGFLEAFEGQDTTNDLSKYEIWTAVLASDNYFFFITLITPNRDADYFTWARNTGAFKMMLRYVEPIQEDYVEFDENTPVQLDE